MLAEALNSKNAVRASIVELQQHFQEISATIHNLSHQLHSATLEHLGRSRRYAVAAHGTTVHTRGPVHSNGNPAPLAA